MILKPLVILTSISLAVCAFAQGQKEEYLAIWKDFVISSQNISEKYFNEHITVTGTEEFAWKEGVSFIVKYRYTLDWAREDLCDSFLIKRKDSSAYLAKEEIYSLSSLEGGLKGRTLLSNACGGPKKITKIDSIISRARAEDILKTKCHPNINAAGTGLTKEGKLTLWGRGVVSQEKNKGICGQVNLVTGEIVDCYESALRVH